MREEQALKVNQRVEVLLPNNGEKGFQQYSSRVEEITEKYVIIAMPMSKGVPLILEKGKEFMGKLFAAGNCFIFKSVFHDKRLTPLPVWIIARPQEIKKIQQRAFVRLDVALPVIVKYQPADETETMSISALTKNISGGGIQAIVNQPLKLGSKLQLEIKLAEKEEFQAEGEVVRVHKPQDDRSLFWTGIKFIGLQETIRDKIIRFIFKKQLEQRQKGL